MATFKGGQRVKILEGDAQVGVTRIVTKQSAIGKEAIFLCYITDEICDCTILCEGRELFMASAFLAPLTDPKADEFIESLKKLAREPMPMERTHA